MRLIKRLLGGLAALVAAVSVQGQVTISNLPQATLPLTGNELVPLQQSGLTRQTQVSNLPGGGGGISTTFQINGTNTLSNNPINFLNASPVNGFTLSYLNPSAGNVQLALSGILTPAGGGTGAASLAAANIPVQSGAITSGDCVKWLNATTIGDAGAACGTGGGGGGGGISSIALTMPSYFNVSPVTLTSNGTIAVTQTAPITPLLQTVASGGTITPTAGADDAVYQNNTAAAGTLTINAPTGPANDYQALAIRIKSTNVQTFAWNAIFNGNANLPLPVASSGGGLVDYMAFRYDAPNTKWDLVAYLPAATASTPFTGINFPAENLAGGGAAFTPNNSLIYGNPAAPGITISGQFATPAAGLGNQISPMYIYIKSDTADTTTLPTGNKSMNWLTVEGNVGAGSTGGRTAIFGKTTINGTPTTISVGYVGVEGIMNGAANMGGSGTGCPAITTACYNNNAGQIYGGNFNAFTGSGATWIQNLNAQENDVSLVIGASAAKKHALTLIQGAIDSNNAFIEDSAFMPNGMIDRYNLTFTAQLLAGATTGTLTSGSGLTAGGGTGPGGTYAVIFQNAPGDRRYVTISGADPTLTATWSSSCGVSSCGLTANGTNTPTLAGNIAPWNYVFDFGGPTVASASWVNTTLIGGQPRTIGPNIPLVANKGIDWSQFTFVTSELAFPGFSVGANGEATVSTLLISPQTVDLTANSWTTKGLILSEPGALNATDATSTGTVAVEAMYALAPVTLNSTSATTFTQAATLYVPAIACTGNATCTNVDAAVFNGQTVVQNGNLSATGGAGISGGTINLNTNSNNQVNIGSGTDTSNVTIGNAANKTVFTGPFSSSAGTAATFAVSGTNCTSVAAGTHVATQAGLFTVTTGAASATCTITITMGGVAPNGWVCNVDDYTDGTHFITSAVGTNQTCVIKGVQATNGTASYAFSALGY